MRRNATRSLSRTFVPPIQERKTPIRQDNHSDDIQYFPISDYLSSRMEQSSNRGHTRRWSGSAVGMQRCSNCRRPTIVEGIEMRSRSGSSRVTTFRSSRHASQIHPPHHQLDRLLLYQALPMQLETSAASNRMHCPTENKYRGFVAGRMRSRS
jgi:hypothetical protein